MDTLISQIPRVQTQLAYILSEAALFPHISQQDRDDQRRVWRQILAGVKKVIEDIRQAILEGEIDYDELMRIKPASLAVAGSMEDVERFFGASVTTGDE